jgi:hypothetical protein
MDPHQPGIDGSGWGRMEPCGGQSWSDAWTAANGRHKPDRHCRRSAQQHFMAIVGSDTSGLADSLPVPAINKAAGVLESALKRRLFPLRCYAADHCLCDASLCRRQEHLLSIRQVLIVSNLLCSLEAATFRKPAGSPPFAMYDVSSGLALLLDCAHRIHAACHIVHWPTECKMPLYKTLAVCRTDHAGQRRCEADAQPGGHAGRPGCIRR